MPRTCWLGGGCTAGFISSSKQTNHRAFPFLNSHAPATRHAARLRLRGLLCVTAHPAQQSSVPYKAFGCGETSENNRFEHDIPPE